MNRDFFFTISILLISSNLLLGQSDTTKKRINPLYITTQGEQERYWAQEIFDKKYTAQYFELYKGKINTLTETTFDYDQSFISVNFPEKEYKILFEKGIFYPAVFAGYSDGRILEPPQLSGSINKSPVYNFSRTDSLFVGIMEDLEFLNPSPKVKRFKLYLNRHGLINPSMYIFELTNEKATEKTSLLSFITDAKLTFFKFVSILI